MAKSVLIDVGQAMNLSNLLDAPDNIIETGLEKLSNDRNRMLAAATLTST